MTIRSKIIIFILATIVVILWVGFRFVQNQMASSGHMTGGALLQADPIVTGLIIPDFKPVERIGERLFVENCAACHGKNAAGQRSVAPPLVHKIYEPSHHGDIAFQLAAKNGVRAHHWPFGNMPPVPNVTENDVTNITSYVRALQSANGIN